MNYLQKSSIPAAIYGLRNEFDQLECVSTDGDWVGFGCLNRMMILYLFPIKSDKQNNENPYIRADQHYM